MNEYAVDSAFAYAGALDISPMLQSLSVAGTYDVLDRTTMRNHNGSRARRFKGGLFNVDVTFEGLTDLTDNGPDEQNWAALTTRASRFTIAGMVETEGQPCYLLPGLTPRVDPHRGGIGELAKSSIGMVSTNKWGPLRGPLLVEQAAVSTTGAKGTSGQHGAVGADQQLFTGICLLGTPGSSITTVLESDDNAGFATATTRVTFGPHTAAGGYFATPVAGAITDDYWRIRVTAVTGSWILAAAMSIE